MPSCPRCHQSISATAVTCSNCGLELKAHGHPGIDLHRSQDDAYLCDTCSYQQDDTCTFPQRPLAKTCTLYQDMQTLHQRPLSAAEIYSMPWWRKHSGWLVLAMLLVLSVLLVVL